MENQRDREMQEQQNLPETAEPVKNMEAEKEARKQKRGQMVTKVLSYILAGLVGATVTALIVSGFLLPRRNVVSGDTKLNALESLILQCFIGEKDQTKMEDAAAQAMIHSLGDRWSYYIPAAEYASYEEQMKNAYVGIGVTVANREDGNGLNIVKVTESGPAEEAGIKLDDIIIAVDGHKFSPENINEVKDMIRGEENTKVSLTVARDGKELNIEVTRRRIHTPVAVGSMLPDNVGLIRIVNFNDNCANEAIGIIEDLKKQGAEKIIFDVRFNPGGYAAELVKLLDYLLPEGELFRRVDYTGKEYVDKSDAKFLDMPMAVLVNGDSYSAAEFFAAALSEYEAATVVGERTCGKGYFQNTFKLPDGSAVGLSIGKYFTPKGVSLAGVGITPDHQVTVSREMNGQIYNGLLKPEDDPQIQAALEALK